MFVLEPVITVNTEGFKVDIGIILEHIKKKIDLLETWMKEFNQVSSVACLGGTNVELSHIDIYDIC
ncbi:hypothetical protein [Clostridium sp.]|uniref:hypothetical protein n=1 Tax=Clostridium sp. TaxID=1506 RepID=UPI00261D74D6|nr:hypothetical protein [Clostridium sp.]